MPKITNGILEGWWMFYETFWALIFGFALSGIVQALVTRKQMSAIMGDHRSSTVARASFFGMVSSSCSYAASALAHSLYKKGADFTASMVFMFASTNLVIELGIVLWLLLGWQFALAEFVGGAVMILLLKLFLPLILTKEESKLSEFQIHVTGVDRAAGSEDETSDMTEASSQSWRAKVSASAGFTIGDFTMLRVELVVGFIVAGLATTIVPLTFWKALFLTGHGLWSAIENVLIGPFIALISFVCSVGNVPLAAALWKSGITFGGVIAFIFADLISFPLVMIYRKYYGKRLALKMLFVFWATMSLSGLVTEGVFRLIHQIPSHKVTMMNGKHFGWNTTTYLNALALATAGVIFYFYKNPLKNQISDFAQDPICGMQVRKSDAPTRYKYLGETLYFCMEGCKEAFIKQAQPL
jgi:uncharacterized membrane protein YraQ (UPF0718 family)/YHS domain-containing protein